VGHYEPAFFSSSSLAAQHRRLSENAARRKRSVDNGAAAAADEDDAGRLAFNFTAHNRYEGKSRDHSCIGRTRRRN